MFNEITGKIKSKDSYINKINQSGGNLLEYEFSIHNEFNFFFVTVGKNIENNCLKRKFDELSWDIQNTNCNNNKSIFFNPIRNVEIEKYINKLKDHTFYVEDIEYF